MLHDDVCQTTVGHIRPVRLRPLLLRLVLADKLMVEKRLTLSHRFLTEVFISVPIKPTKDWTSETTVRNLFSLFSYILVPFNKACCQIIYFDFRRPNLKLFRLSIKLHLKWETLYIEGYPYSSVVGFFFFSNSLKQCFLMRMQILILNPHWKNGSESRWFL